MKICLEKGNNHSVGKQINSMCGSGDLTSVICKITAIKPTYCAFFYDI